jgi:bifunctional DNA-binding transcriptional regulator/antitoxin component of YhaV-PrlF toxin-antitoxin module
MTDKTRTITISKPFQVREDSALTMPDYVLDMLKWKKGDRLTYVVDPVTQKLIVSLFEE